MIEELKLIEVKEEKDFDPLSLCSDPPLTQSFFYGKWHEAVGHKVRRFKAEEGGAEAALFQVLKLPLPFNSSILYIPYGPVLGEALTEKLASFLRRKFLDLSKEESAIFLRTDFYPLEKVESETNILDGFFTKASLSTYRSAGFQPRSEWMLRIDRNKEELLKRMASNTRQSFSVSERKGVKVKIVSGEEMVKYFELFMDLLEATSKRGGFTLSCREYYEAIFKTCKEKGNGFLSIASFKGEDIVADLVLVFGRRANWLYSGSKQKHREKHPTYLSLWNSILEAKRRGALWFNFGAVASGSGVYKDWEGFTSFKKRFGGVEIKHTPFYDVVARPAHYALYKAKKKVDCL